MVEQRSTRARAATPASSPGPSVDRDGAPVIDPTKNVADMLNAAIERQDDLRNLESQHIREIMALRTELFTVHSDYREQLARQEAARIDAIRAVDVAAGARAAEVSVMQASVLSTQVAQTAEAMRNQVAAAASAAATALSTALQPIQESINDLRKAQFEQQGQRIAQTEGREVKQGSQSNIVAVVAVVASVLIGAIVITLTIIKMN